MTVDEKFLMVCRRCKLSPRTTLIQLKSHWVSQVEHLVVVERILQTVRNGRNPNTMARPPRRTTAATADPLGSIPPSTEANDPLNDLLGGGAAEAPGADPLDALMGLGGSGEGPTPVNGMAGLRGAVSAQTVRESVSRGGAAGPDPVVAGALQEIQAKVAKLPELEVKLSSLITLMGTVTKAFDAIQKQLAAFDIKLEAGNATILGAINELYQDEDPAPATEQAQSPKPTKTASLTPQPNPIADALLPLLAAKKASEAQAGRKFESLPLANKVAVFGALAKQLATTGVQATPEAIEKALTASGSIRDGVLYF